MAVCGGLAAGLILSMVSHGIDVGNVNGLELSAYLLSFLVGCVLCWGYLSVVEGLLVFISECIKAARHPVSKPSGT